MSGQSPFPETVTHTLGTNVSKKYHVGGDYRMVVVPAVHNREAASWADATYTVNEPDGTQAATGTVNYVERVGYVFPFAPDSAGFWTAKITYGRTSSPFAGEEIVRFLEMRVV